MENETSVVTSSNFLNFNHLVAGSIKAIGRIVLPSCAIMPSWCECTRCQLKTLFVEHVQGMMLAAACCVSADEEEGSFEPSIISPKDDVSQTGVLFPGITVDCLPDEVLVKVFSYLPAEDLAWEIPKVCKRWARVSEDSEVWRNKIYEPASFTHYLSVADCLRRVPKLEGLSISHSAPMETVRNVCKYLNMYSHNIKYLSLPVEVSKRFPLKSVMPKKLACLVTLNLRFCESFVVSQFLDLYSAQIVTCVGLCQNLQSLTLGGLISCDAVAFKAIAVGCAKLQILDVKACEMNAHGGLKCLLKRENDTIISLGLSWSLQNNKRTLPLIAKYCHKLQKLSIIEPVGRYHFQPPYNVTSYDVAALRHMTHLKELTLRRIKGNILEEFIELIVSGLFKNLEKLDFSYNLWVTNIFLVYIFRNCPNLKSLHFRCCCGLTSDAFPSIALLRHLEYLNLEGCERLRDEAIFHIVKCRKLRYLNVNRIFAFTRLSLNYCSEFLKYLEELHIMLRPVYDEDLKKIPCRLRLFLNHMTDR
ncbi:Uncharacterized protein GBIM_19825 [Gryllus bimaculatus]|nr:Uncharacterized protein GBIM_19825 [Gryllus bimaculatus]